MLYHVMYECTCKKIESLKLIKITTFDQNHLWLVILFSISDQLTFVLSKNYRLFLFSRGWKTGGTKTFQRRSQGVNLLRYRLWYLKLSNFRKNFLWLSFLFEFNRGWRVRTRVLFCLTCSIHGEPYHYN